MPSEIYFRDTVILAWPIPTGSAAPNSASKSLARPDALADGTHDHFHLIFAPAASVDGGGMKAYDLEQIRPWQ